MKESDTGGELDAASGDRGHASERDSMRWQKHVDFQWQGVRLGEGASFNVNLPVGQSYSGLTIHIPLHIRRGESPGPVVFVTAAIHGDEINGTGAIRQLIQDPEFALRRGTVVFAPVINVLAFDRHERYLPDRRDLNRHFPGSRKGSMASRYARNVFRVFQEKCDCGIDLHTAAMRRTNYPNIRADLTNPEIRDMALAFGCDVVIDNMGPEGSFRRELSKRGCPTIVFEGGEPYKVEPSIVEAAVRGIKNVLVEFNMLDQEPERADRAVVIKRAKWTRADEGGFLRFHVQPGEFVVADQPLATNTTLLGEHQMVVTAPFDAVVLGMTTLPAISPGDPICHLGELPKAADPDKLQMERQRDDSLEARVVEDLASNVLVEENPEFPSAADTPQSTPAPQPADQPEQTDNSSESSGR